MILVEDFCGARGGESLIRTQKYACNPREEFHLAWMWLNSGTLRRQKLDGLEEDIATLRRKSRQVCLCNDPFASRPYELLVIYTWKDYGMTNIVKKSLAALGSCELFYNIQLGRLGSGGRYQNLR